MVTSRFLTFTAVPWQEDGKPLWRVASKSNDGTLGEIKWFPRWRRFVFEPEFDCVFDPTCLRDIAGFCDEQTSLQKRPSAQLPMRAVTQ